MPPESQGPSSSHQPPNHLPPSVMPPINMTPPPDSQLSTNEDLLEPDEQELAVVRRHPIGIFGIYLETLIGLLVVTGLLFAVAPDFFNGLSSQAYQIMVAVIVLGLAILVFFLFVATYVYRQCRLLITNRSLVQILQKSLFIRKVSRLSFSNVEDVTAEQRGILASILNYGTLLIQTAGTEDNFEFKYCPRPNRYADQIIEARQRYARSLEEEHEAELAQHLHDMGLS
ncbi:hypothetical protein BVY00_01940 [bacterium G20]|nr:hypothetical protein BVY00_01940 [bacterium G20]